MHTILCVPCSHKGYLSMIGQCEECGGMTASSSYKLCRNCADGSTKRCQACGCDASADAAADGSPTDQNS